MENNRVRSWLAAAPPSLVYRTVPNLALKPPGAAILVSRGSKSLQAAPAVERRPSAKRRSRMLKDKREGTALAFKTFVGSAGTRYLVFRSLAGSFHVFAEVE